MFKNRSWRSIGARLLLVALGLALAAGLFLLLLRLFPDLEPGQRVVFTVYDGDTFRQQPGQVRPPAENTVLEDLILRLDADGFRRPRLAADHYPIIALGDSFTDGGQVPWVDVLAETLGVPVRNLGRSGFGPLEYARVMDLYGGAGHDWVVIGYFEGNDLSNIHTAYQQREANGGELVIQIQQTHSENIQQAQIVTSPDGRYLYPLEHFINGETVELAYISDYLWWLNAPQEVYRESRNVAELRAALADIRDRAGTACVALLYIPVKGHIYFPYADPAGNRRYVLENGRVPFLTGDGWIDLGGLTPVTYEALLANLDSQREVIREVAADLGLGFIDLVPVLQAAVETGPPSYYAYDSHWNERGHALAGAAVAEFLRGAVVCPLGV